MRRIFNLQFFFALGSIFGVLAFSGCADLGNPNYSGGYRDPYYDPYDYDSRDSWDSDDYYRDKERERYRRKQRELEKERNRVKKERRELEKERKRAEEERRRLEKERKKENQSYRPKPTPRPTPPPETCPPGFRPSSQKCTKEERKRGCKDIRRSSSLLCVNR